MIHIRPYPIVLHAGNDLEGIRKNIKESMGVSEVDLTCLENPGDYHFALVTTIVLGEEPSGHIAAWFRDTPEHSTLVHEAVHIKNKLFSYCGMELNALMICDEHEAYLVQSIYDDLAKVFEEAK